MILGRLDDANAYGASYPNLEKGFAYLRSCDFSKLEDGVYEIDGRNLFMQLSTYETKSPAEKHPEAHREYIDIQYVVSGKELAGWAPLDEMTAPLDAYPERDLYFYQGDTIKLPFEQGRFMVFYPQDAHAPSLHPGEPATVRKALIKVKL